MAAIMIVMVLLMAGPSHGYGHMGSYDAPRQAEAAYTQVDRTATPGEDR